MADTLTLDVHGVGARLSGDRAALTELAAHFASFRTSFAAQPTLHVELHRGPPVLDLPGRRAADQIVDRGLVYNVGDVTWVDHHGHASSRYDFAREHGAIHAPRVEDLVELGYLMLHSRLGVHLERRGLFRLHCMGIVAHGEAALVLAPSGGGKSRLALAALTHTDAALLGDDLVLIDRSGRVRAFHSPLGVSSAEQGRTLGNVRSFQRRLHPSKYVVELDGLATRLAHGPLPVSRVVLARRVNQGPSALVPASRRDGFGALWRDMVVGLGLPQVLELVARHGAKDLAGLAPTALRRLGAATALARGATFGVLEIESPESAIELLVARLAGSGRPCA